MSVPSTPDHLSSGALSLERRRRHRVREHLRDREFWPGTGPVRRLVGRSGVRPAAMAGAVRRRTERGTTGQPAFGQWRLARPDGRLGPDWRADHRSPAAAPPEHGGESRRPDRHVVSGCRRVETVGTTRRVEPEPRRGRSEAVVHPPDCMGSREGRRPIPVHGLQRRRGG